MEFHDIAIIGMSGRFPEADNLQEFWANLTASRDSIREFPQSRRIELHGSFGPQTARYVKNGYLNSTAYFDPAWFGISAEEARFIDPQHRLTLELVEEAVQDAGYRVDEIAASTVGAFMAHASNRYGTYLAHHPHGVVNGLESALAGRVAYTNDFRGPVLTIDTACSSSLVALHQACVSLLVDDCDYAIVGGCHAFVLPPTWEVMKDYIVFARSEKLRAFAKGADGTLGGEGGGILLLKTLERAKKDNDPIRAVIKATGVNSDAARSNGLSAPSQAAQTELIRKVVIDARIPPDSISYLEAHGTGTELGDPIEFEGIHQAFPNRTRPLPIGTVKSNIGHLVGMAGFAGLAKVVLSFEHRKIPASLNFDSPNPHIDFANSVVYVNDRLTDWPDDQPVLRAGVSSFGIIGTNGHAVLEEAPPREFLPAADKLCLIPLSANSEQALRIQAAALERFLEEHPTLRLQDVAFTLAVGRRHLPVRTAFVVANLEELRTQLRNVDASRALTTQDPLVFLFSAFDELSVPDESHSCVLGAEQVGADAPVCELSPAIAWIHAHARAMVQIGLFPRGVLGWGAGKIIAQSVLERTSARALQETLSSSRPHSSPSADDIAARFQQVLSRGYGGFTYFGPASELTGPLARIAAAAQKPWLPVSSLRSFLVSIGAHYCEGRAISWHQLLKSSGGVRVSLPPTLFDRQFYFPTKRDLWADWTASTAPTPSGSQSGTTGSSNEPTQSPKTPTREEAEALLARFLPSAIDLDSSFEDNGGDSIAIIECSGLFEETHGIHLSPDDFYNASSLADLIDKIVRPQATRLPPEKDQGASAEMRPSAGAILSETHGVSRENAEILVTGATGFLGAHVVRELLQRWDGPIKCLVRADSEKSANTRLHQRLHQYFGSSVATRVGSQVLAVRGDVEKDQLGLDRPTYAHLLERVSKVVHAAADVRQIAPSAALRLANVEGTQRVIDFCVSGHPKELHHCSTYVVSGRGETPREFSEADLHWGQTFLGSKYAETKFEAEVLIRSHLARGLRATVYRVGNLTGRYEDGAFQDNVTDNLLYGSLRGFLDLRCYPHSLAGSTVELCPVDLCAAALVSVLTSGPASGQTVHLMNPSETLYSSLFQAMTAMGDEMTALATDEEFIRRLQEQVRGSAHSAPVRKLSMLYGKPTRSVSAGPITHKPTYTFGESNRILTEAGFSWPALDRAYFVKMLGVVKRWESTGNEGKRRAAVA